jgi:hypothetical protein
MQLRSAPSFVAVVAVLLWQQGRQFAQRRQR